MSCQGACTHTAFYYLPHPHAFYLSHDLSWCFCSRMELQSGSKVNHNKTESRQQEVRPTILSHKTWPFSLRATTRNTLHIFLHSFSIFKELTGRLGTFIFISFILKINAKFNVANIEATMPKTTVIRVE